MSAAEATASGRAPRTFGEVFRLAIERGLPHADKALKNCPTPDQETCLQAPSAALLGAFFWEKSPEGHAFWKKVRLEWRAA